MQSQEGIPSIKRRKCAKPGFWDLSLYQKTSMPCHVISKLGRWKQENSLGLRVTSLAKILRDSGSKNNLESTLDIGPWPLPVYTYMLAHLKREFFPGVKGNDRTNHLEMAHYHRPAPK